MQAHAQRPATFYQSLPKVELHRHLEGSWRLKTIYETAQNHTPGLAAITETELSKLVQIQKSDPTTMENFLSKFDTIRMLYRTPEIIHQITYEAIADAAADNIRYLELRFTPVALSRQQDYSLADVMDWVIDSTQKASAEFGILTRLIASVNRHESVHLAEQVAQLAVDRQAQGVVGLDLAGNEGQYPAAPFADVFKQASLAGLKLTIHAGEWNGTHNIHEAIETFGAARIGHGVRILEDPAAVALAVEHGTIFEVCPTSNLQSGVFTRFEDHSLRQMVDAGLAVTLNTDDPGISNIMLSGEYALACEKLGLTLTELEAAVTRAAGAAFLPLEKAKTLATSIGQEFQTTTSASA